MSGNLWHHQTCWNQKKEIYGALIQSLQDLLISLNELQVYSMGYNYMNSADATFTPEDKRDSLTKMIAAFTKLTDVKLQIS